MKIYYKIVIIFFVFLLFSSYVNAACSSTNLIYSNDFDSSGLDTITAGSWTVSGGTLSAADTARAAYNASSDTTYTFVTRMKSTYISSEYAKISPFTAADNDQCSRIDFMGGTSSRVTNFKSDCGSYLPPLVSNAVDTWYEYTVEVNNGDVKIWQDDLLIFGPFTYGCADCGSIDGDPGLGVTGSGGTVSFDFLYYYNEVDCGPGFSCGAGKYLSDGSCTNVGAGYYSPANDDSRYSCTAGYYCSSATNSVGTGDGACTAGYYCPSGSTSATQNACGSGYYCPAGSGSATACPTNSDTAGATTSDALSDCVGNAGYYNCEDGTCDAAGDDYWSADNSNSRTQCAANSGTGGVTTSSAATDCNCDTDYYDGDGGTQDCTAVGSGYYSATNSDSRAACSNKPTLSSYTSSGSGTNSCPFDCDSDLDETSQCTLANSTIIFTNKDVYYHNLTIGLGGKIYLDNTNLSIKILTMNTIGDLIYVEKPSKLIIEKYS